MAYPRSLAVICGQCVVTDNRYVPATRVYSGPIHQRRERHAPDPAAWWAALRLDAGASAAVCARHDGEEFSGFKHRFAAAEVEAEFCLRYGVSKAMRPGAGT